MKGADYSTARPALDTLKADGIQFVCRYLTGSGKALTSGEVQALRDAGLGIVPIFEEGAGNALLGSLQGTPDGLMAKQAADALGIPDTVAIYATVDTDTRDLQTVELYARAFADAIAPRPLGMYASGLILRHLTDTGVAAFTWQTMSTGWAGGAYPGATIVQQGSGMGGEIDFDESTTDAFGAWWPNDPTRSPEVNMAMKDLIPRMCVFVYPARNPGLTGVPYHPELAGHPCLAGVETDGSVYCSPAKAYLGGANGKQFFANRQAAGIEAIPGGYRITDAAGERYDFPTTAQ